LKETVALMMLGRCYRMCFLLITEKRLIELETDVLKERVPSYAMPYGIGLGGGVLWVCGLRFLKP
jgi:hypothetical protein